MTSRAWSCSAHAKDIWTQSRPSLIAALASSQWTVTCSRHGYEQLKSLSPRPDRIHLSYHGLDVDRFSHFAGARPPRTGGDPERPLQILSIARAVPKRVSTSCSGPSPPWARIFIGASSMSAEAVNSLRFRGWRGPSQ